MIAKNCGGRVPEPGPRSAEDEALVDAARALLPVIRDEMRQFGIHKMLEAIWRVVADANRYVDAQAPWALRKSDPARMNTVLYVLADVIRMLAIYVQPVVPGGAGRLLDQLGVSEEFRNFSDLESNLQPGAELPKPAPAFPRFVEEEAA